MIWYDMIWYDMIWYDMIWYDMIWYDTIRYDTIYDMIWYDMIWYDMIGYDIWCDMIWWKDIIWSIQTTKSAQDLSGLSPCQTFERNYDRCLIIKGVIVTERLVSVEKKLWSCCGDKNLLWHLSTSILFCKPDTWFSNEHLFQIKHFHAQ